MYVRSDFADSMIFISSTFHRTIFKRYEAEYEALLVAKKPTRRMENNLKVYYCGVVASSLHII